MSIIWMVGLLAAMIIFPFMSQRKQRKERTAMMEAMKKGDRVVTVGGIYGIIRGIKDDRITLEVASEVYMQFTKAAIGSVLKSSEAKAAGAPEPAAIASGKEDDAADDADYVIEQDEDGNENA